MASITFPSTAQSDRFAEAAFLSPALDGNPATLPRFSKSAAGQSTRLFQPAASTALPSHSAPELDPLRLSATPPEPDWGPTGAIESKRLHLEVIVNGVSKKLIGEFLQLADGRMASASSELLELGLIVDGRRAHGDLVILNDLPGVAYQYDERGQRLSISAPNETIAPKNFDLRPNSEFVPARSDYGGVLNYSLLTTTSSWLNPSPFTFTGTSLSLDGRMFTPFGTLSQSAILLASPAGDIDGRRLNTTYSHSNQETMVTARGGDTISGSLPWTRSIRVGGLQAQRSFGLRPDLVTTPLPTINGSAAVPSTVDLYVNNIKTFTQDVGSGPFSLSNIPMISGAGNAQIVVRDSAGHETRVSVPFYASPTLLAKDLSSFSVEAGFPRLAYGTASDGYSEQPVASATLRRGIFDWMTVEGHAEAGGGLLSGGAGAVVRTGSIGVGSAAATVSHFRGAYGVQSHVAYETKLFGVTANASSQMTFGPYDDLASVTATMQATIPSSSASAASFTGYGQNLTPLFASARPPKMLHRLSVGMPTPFDAKSFISASIIALKDVDGQRSKILTASWSRELSSNASIYATAFHDSGDRKNLGVFAGVSIQLAENVSASSSIASGRRGTDVTTDLIKPIEQKPDSWGWRLRDTEGKSASREASVSYRSPYALVQAGISQDRNGTRGVAQVDGAIATVGGNVFLANRIDDSFAVVDTGVPNVEVSYENRAMGTTDKRGQLIIPNLRSYQKNKIAIEARNLPVDAEVETTKDIVVPADRSGVVVKFGIRTETRAAIVVFAGLDGKPLPPGSAGKIEGGDTFVVGYDGQAYIKNLKAINVATVDLDDRTCKASFQYAPRPNEQVLIPSIVCR